MNTSRETEQRIIEKATKDSQYRRRLMANPRETLEQEMGRRLPTSLRVKVIEEDPDVMVLVLPRVSHRELSDDDLAIAAGGGRIRKTVDC